jgi:hypothetical protein
VQTTLAADVKFLLKDPRTTNVTLVPLVYRYESRRFVYSTGQFIEPYQWDSENQRARTNQKNRTDRQLHETINAHLDRHRAAFVRVLNALQLAGEPFDNAMIKHHLDNQLGRVRVTKPQRVEVKESFTDFITRFVADAKAGKRLNAKNSRFADGTLKNFMKITGHKSETQFMKYIKVTGEQNARLLLDHPHFSGISNQSTTDVVRPMHKAGPRTAA